MRANIIKKSIDRTFVLRVSGKGDDKGNKNQLEVLQAFRHLADVAAFLKAFDVRMMKASSAVGAALRSKWERERGLKILTWQGKKNFLGLSVVVGRSRFVMYASTAAGMDEESGNAFTRHVCEAITDPTFCGTADPEFMALCDGGAFDGQEHPSLVHAFDATRFCRTVTSATQMYDAAERNLVALEARDLQIDPAQGGHMKMMWIFVAYGSEMEAIVGKQRRFVGRLNAARDGLWPYRPGMTPLGVTCPTGPETKGSRRLQVDEKLVASVAKLATLGLDPSNGDEKILRILGGAPFSVVSTHPTTFGKPVSDLDPAAAKRLFLRRKLEGYRDGELVLPFVGVAQNQLRVGSGHVLRRRWEGHDKHGEPDRLGGISYRVPMPKPVVIGRDGKPRRGWLAGMSDQEERAAWNRLIALRGTDDRGRRPAEELDQELLDANSDLGVDDRKLLAQELERVQKRSKGGRQGERVVSSICPPYRTSDAGDTGPRHFLRHRAAGIPSELRREACSPKAPDGGIVRKGSLHLGTFEEAELTAALATLVIDAVRLLTDEGVTVGTHQLRTSQHLQELIAASDPAAERAQQVTALRLDAEAQRKQARGYDATLAAERGTAEPDEERIQDLEQAAGEARKQSRQLAQQADELEQAPLAPAATCLPPLNGADPRDFVAALRGPYGTGSVPGLFLEAVDSFCPRGVHFRPGNDSLELEMVADVCLATVAGDAVTLTGMSTTVPNHLGRGAGGLSKQRAAEMTARYMAGGCSLEQAARAAGTLDLLYARGRVEATLADTNRMPDPAKRLLAAQCQVAEGRSVLHAYATTDGFTARDGYERHMVGFYGAEVPAGRHPGGTGRGWAYELDLDARLDQTTVLRALPDPGRGLVAAALGGILNPNEPKLGLRWVQDASTVRHRQFPYPAATRRLPAPGFPDGWHGVASGSLTPDSKRVGPALCSYDDCKEPYADVLCPVAEVLALGAMVLCRRCLRAAVPPKHPQRTLAAGIRFPVGYVDWADSQITRTGRIVACAAACALDVGLGPGKTWRWDETSAEQVWHDDDCRVGAVTQQYLTCRYLDCQVDQGGGPGAVRQTSRIARVWHSRDCEHAERRRERASTVRYSRCTWALCTRDDGDGPGSIASTDKRRRVVHDTDDCHRGARRNPRTD